MERHMQRQYNGAVVTAQKQYGRGNAISIIMLPIQAIAAGVVAMGC
jgi:hypothetical protein